MVKYFIAGVLCAVAVSGAAADTTVAVLNGSIRVKASSAQPSASYDSSVHREIMLFDSSNGQYQMIELGTKAGKKVYELTASGTLPGFELPTDASNQKHLAFFQSATSANQLFPNPFLISSDASWTQMQGVEGNAAVKLAGMASPFPSTLTYLSFVYTNETSTFPIPNVPPTVTQNLSVTTGVFTLDVKLTKENSVGNANFSDALTALLADLVKKSYGAN